MNQTVKLYSSQPCAISDQIQHGDTHYAKMHFIREKYGEDIAPVFVNAYTWFIRQAEQLLPRPNEAESAIWAYYDLHNLEKHPGHEILELAVPLTELVFFSMGDWNKVLNQRFIGLSDQENTAFANKLERQGITYEGDLFRKPFYPQLKQEVMKSWLNMFRFHRSILDAIMIESQELPIKDIQAALWKLPSTWVKRVSI